MMPEEADRKLTLEFRQRRAESQAEAIKYTSRYQIEMGYQRGVRDFLRDLRAVSADLAKRRRSS